MSEEQVEQQVAALVRKQSRRLPDRLQWVSWRERGEVCEWCCDDAANHVVAAAQCAGDDTLYGEADPLEPDTTGTRRGAGPLRARNRGREHVLWVVLTALVGAVAAAAVARPRPVGRGARWH